MDNTVENAGNTADVDVTTTETETTATDTEVNPDGGTQTETNTGTQDTEQGASQDASTSGFDFDKLNLPEGVSASDEDKKGFSDLLQRFGVNEQEKAQAFADWVFETAQQAQKDEDERNENSKKEWENIKAGWKASLEGDADFGKNYDINMKRANDAIVRFGGKELQDWLKESDLSGHPALLKTFARIGKEIEDAKLLTGQAGKEISSRKYDRYGRPMIVYKDE